MMSDHTPVDEFGGLAFMPALNDACQYSTVYNALTNKPLGTLQRRRVLESGPVWTLYATDGALLRKVYFVPRTYTALARLVRNTLKGQ